jgi:hypothetical protein
MCILKFNYYQNEKELRRSNQFNYYFIFNLKIKRKAK